MIQSVVKLCQIATGAGPWNVIDQRPCWFAWHDQQESRGQRWKPEVAGTELVDALASRAVMRAAS
jgi:hypothetical protein